MADMAAAGVANVVPRTGEQGCSRAGFRHRLATRLELRRVLGYDALSLLALSGLAITQPLLDLFGKNPEFFVASEAGPAQIVAFGVAIAFGVPFVALGVELVAHAVGPRAGAFAHAVLIGMLGIAFGATVARQFDFTRSLPVVVLSVGIGGLILLAERRTHAMRLGLRYLAVAPLLFLALFVFTSATSRLLWEDEAQAETGVPIADPKPVVMIVLDEFPLASIIKADGQIDATRFPNFARLATGSTWFRNATSLSPNTPGSVPTIESGLEPKHDALPTSIDYPRNLFTLLGGSYQMDVTETVTQLCPTTLCVRTETGAPPGLLDGLRQNLQDASIVYGQATLPPNLRHKLPSVDQSWGGFLADDATEVPDDGNTGGEGTSASTTSTSTPGIDEFMSARIDDMRATQPPGKGALVRTMIPRVGPETSSRLYFVHDNIPHFNWLTTPDGHTYHGPNGPPGSVDGVWGDDEFLIRQGQQRHLLQVGYTDMLVGQLIDQLEDQGVWDDAVVVVTADHGIAFTANLPKRTPADETVDEIYRVPLFIRAPGEPTGEVSDENALLIDILPTLVDVLGVDTPWHFDGRSLFGDEPEPTEKPVFYGIGPSSVPLSIDGLLAVAQRNHERFPEPGWRGVAAVESLGRLLGTSVADLDVTDNDVASAHITNRSEFDAVDDDAGGSLPLMLDGELTLEGDTEPYRTALVSLNGKVAGVAGDFVRDGASWRFSALLDFEQFHGGRNDVELLLVAGGGDRPPFLRVPLR